MSQAAADFTVSFCPDAASFLAAAGDHLAERPVEGTVVTSVADRQIRDAADGVAPGDQPYNWFAVVTDTADVVVGAAMRTAGAPPYRAFLLSMPGGAATALVRALHEQGEVLAGANGALPAVEVAMTETARLAGGTLRVVEESRLWELAELREPSGVGGRLRQARPEETDDLVPWFQGFAAEAAAMSGREPSGTSDFSAADVRRRIERDTVWVWEVDGEVVHLTGANPPAYGVARIGPVLTPREHRGRGYASAVVAGVARRLREGGARVCLFTDQANPTSNKIYADIGFVPLVEMAALDLIPPVRV